MGNYNDGVRFYGSGDKTQAQQQFKLALQKNPDLAEAHLNLGLIYLEDEDWDGAEQSTRRAIAIFERTKRTYVEGSTWQESLSVAYSNLGGADLGRTAQAAVRGDRAGTTRYCLSAAASFRHALELDPGNSKARGNLNRLTGIC
jgi:Flp pilus assembly protein TadD